MAELDLVIRRGQAALVGALIETDIGISGGRIVQIGGEMEAPQQIDAAHKLVLPGAVDAHVHLTIPPAQTGEPHWVDDFTSGSAGALAGGVTTLGNMSFLAPGELPLDGLEREAALARKQAIADYFLHPVLHEPTPQVLDQIPALRASGCNSLKIFLFSPNFDTQVRGYVEAIRRAGEQGMITLLHCEDYALIEDATQQLMKAGLTSLRHYARSRPAICEVVATQRAISFAEATGAPVYIVHLSAQRALAPCRDAQARGVPVYVETRPLYLHLTEVRFAEPHGAIYVGQPPLRLSSDTEALWQGIAQGTVHTVCTDHAPWSLAAKLDPTLSILDLRPGMENLQVMLPMLYSEGVRRGRISHKRFVEVTSTNAARLFGLYPRKGIISVGSDADLVVFDPSLTRTITASMLLSNSDFSVYEGREVTGWPVLTIRRGEVVYRDGQVLGRPGSGLLLGRGATAQL